MKYYSRWLFRRKIVTNNAAIERRNQPFNHINKSCLPIKQVSKTSFGKKEIDWSTKRLWHKQAPFSTYLKINIGITRKNSMLIRNHSKVPILELQHYETLCKSIWWDEWIHISIFYDYDVQVLSYYVVTLVETLTSAITKVMFEFKNLFNHENNNIISYHPWVPSKILLQILLLTENIAWLTNQVLNIVKMKYYRMQVSYIR